jgi:hypothetical protein
MDHIYGNLWHRFSAMINEVMIATNKLSKWRLQHLNYELWTIGSLASLFAATFYQGHPDMKDNLWNIISTERYIIPIMLQVLLECCYISMESSLWENWVISFCSKVLFSTGLYWQFLGVSQDTKQIRLYLWYPFFKFNLGSCD